MMEPEQSSGVRRSVRTPNWTTLGLAGGLLILVLLVAYLVSGRNPDQDKLTQNELAHGQQKDEAAPERLCSSRQTYDFIKRELFRRAAQVRGSDQPAFDQLSGYAVVRMENPVMESQDNSTGAVNCSGSLSLDLPPGVAVVGGRRTLTADVDYSVQRAADGSGKVVQLRNADPIVTPLATLARAMQPAPAPEEGMEMNEAAPELPPAGAPPVATGPSAGGANPSFDCADAQTKGEVAVCGDAGLAALDRRMAAQFNQAMDSADSDQRKLLLWTRSRFVRFRDQCSDNSCIAQAYRGRIREISDIMAGRWQPQ